jgi:hypothetical protein
MAPPPADGEVSAGSILRELVFNQYQAIVLGGTALASLVTLNPLPLLLWLGSELVLLPMLDSGPLRRLVARRKLAVARAKADADRARVVGSLTPANAKRYAAMEHLCRQIEQNYQGLTGISQAYLSEQRGKLDVILLGYLNRLQALQRYERMPMSRNAAEIEDDIAAINAELQQEGLPARAAAALQKNLELKQRLLASVSQVGDTVRTLGTELDSMEALLDVLHQNSISLRDPIAIAGELDSIVRQSEDSERIVREMETLLRSDATGLAGDRVMGTSALPARDATTGEPGKQRMRTR